MARVAAVTLADYEGIAGDAWWPVHGFVVRVEEAGREPWEGVATCVLKRTVVVQNPRVAEADRCRTLHLKTDVRPLKPAKIRWIEQREGQIAISAKTDRRRAECITMAELLERLGVELVRACDCGRPAKNRFGPPRCRACQLASEAAVARRRRAAKRPPCPCGAPATNTLGRPRCDACRKPRHEAPPPRKVVMCMYECGRPARLQGPRISRVSCEQCHLEARERKLAGLRHRPAGAITLCVYKCGRPARLQGKHVSKCACETCYQERGRGRRGRRDPDVAA